MAKEELTKEDKALAVNVIAKIIRNRVGAENPISASEIKDMFAELPQPYSINGQKLRKLINYLRNAKEMPIASSNKGYFWAKTKEELQECYNSLKGRITAQIITLHSIENTIKKWKKIST